MKIQEHFLDTIREEGLYDKYNDIFITERIGEQETKVFEKNLKRLDLGHLINPKSILVLGKGYKDILINESFDILFLHENLNNAIEVKALIKYVNLSPGRKIDYLPKGYTGICLIELEDKIPNQIYDLKVYGDKERKGEKNVLYLSEKPIYKRLKGLMNKNLKI